MGAPGSQAQTTPAPNDGIGRVMRELERVLMTGDSKVYSALVLPETTTSEEFLEEWIQAGVTRAVVQERLRTESQSLPRGENYDVYVDALAEFGRNGRVGTWMIRVKRVSTATDEWKITGLTVLTTVRGLYRLSLSPEKQYSVVNLAMSAEDFELRVPNGTAFVAETDAGVTGIIILGRGEMTFTPTPAPERGQVKIYCGNETLNARFDWVYLRAHPAEFDRRLDV